MEANCHGADNTANLRQCGWRDAQGDSDSTAGGNPKKWDYRTGQTRLRNEGSQTAVGPPTVLSDDTSIRTAYRDKFQASPGSEDRCGVASVCVQGCEQLLRGPRQRSRDQRWCLKTVAPRRQLDIVGRSGANGVDVSVPPNQWRALVSISKATAFRVALQRQNSCSKVRRPPPSATPEGGM